MQRIAFFILFLFTTSANAGLFIDLNSFYFSDGLATTSTSTSTRMLIDAALGFDIDKKGYYQVGWNYAMHTTTDTTTTTTTYTSTQMGPKFNFYFGKERQWVISFAYNLVTSASYQLAGGTAEKWKGTGLQGNLGYNWMLTESLSFGLRLNYSSTSYNERLINDTTYSTIGYSRTFMYPSIYLGAYF